MPDTDDDTRSAYTAGLRELADWLDAHPDLPLPYEGRVNPIGFYISFKPDQRALLADFARALPGQVAKGEAGTGGHLFSLTAHFAGLAVAVLADRDEVCERVVTGTHLVTKMVPADDAPLVEVTETVEDVEWVCGSILSGATS